MMETLEKNKLCIHNVQTANYTVRNETLNGKPHLVVPVIMMVEGVHSGSGGAVYHRAEELSRHTEAWNGIPVTISHPVVVDEEGNSENVSANSPEVLNTTTVGRIFNTVYRGGLRAECWIDEEKINTVSPAALEYIRSGEPLDVSIGVFSDTDDTEGEWRGETYESTATSYRPDHLALLPGEVGACSWADGCGIRTNKKGGEVDDLLKSFREFSLKGYAVTLINNEEGFQEISSLLQNQLNAMDTNSRMFFLEEVFTNDFVYRVRDIDGGTTLYRRGYSVNNGEMVLAENPVEVRKQVEFVTMKMVRTKKPSVNNNKEGGTMSTEGTLCCEAKVDELIANKQTHWQATDREWLLTLKEATIAKMSPMEPEKAELSADEIQANKDQVIQDYNAGKKSVEDYTEGMPEEMKAQVNGGVKLYKEHKEALVKGIMDNAKEIWTTEALEAMDDATLEKVSKSITKPVDYSGQGNPTGGSNGEAVEIPLQFSQRKEDK